MEMWTRANLGSDYLDPDSSPDSYCYRYNPVNSPCHGGSYEHCNFGFDHCNHRRANQLFDGHHHGGIYRRGHDRYYYRGDRHRDCDRHRLGVCFIYDFS